MTCDESYRETHRPQFHFTSARNWINDPNGLVYYEGEYHLFFQHNPTGITWGNMTWGHAVSPDLVHWTQLENAIEPDGLGTIFSGSAAIDWRDTAGFQSGPEPVLVALYTSAGDYASPPRPFTQSLAYSQDRGRTWSKFEGNPVLGHITGRNRDPRILWHEPSGQWIMALFLDGNEYALFASSNLREWEHLCDLTLPGMSECPDFFELPVDGDPDETKWVFWGAGGGYLLGRFDGRSFRPESGPFQAEQGPNGYAAQTWSDVPREDGRRIQISWMRGGKYPAMPFNQQLSFPVELTLRTFPEGVRLCRWPVREIERLYEGERRWEGRTLDAGDSLVLEEEGELFDVRLLFEPGERSALVLQVRGIDLRYDAAEKSVRFLGRSAHLEPVDGQVDLRLLVDRTSLELFGDEGALSMSFCFLPEAADHPLVLRAEGEGVEISSLSVQELCSAW